MKPNSTRRGIVEGRLIGLCLLLIVVGVMLIARMPQRVVAMDEQRQQDVAFSDFSELFAEIHAAIKERHVEEVSSRDIFEGAINGMFQALDPHSAWLPPEDQELMSVDTEGEYTGVGLHITLDRDKILTAISPVGGSPAARAGVMPWDRIVAINGESTKDITLLEAVHKLTGPAGTKVTIKVWREGETKPLEFTIVRKTIKLESVFSRMLDGKIGYLRISKFQDDTAKSLRDHIEALEKEGIDGVVVDLRNNAGGLLDRAVEICDFFLPEKQLIVSIKGRSKSNNRAFYSVDEPICEVPMVVLVNRGSASASEIFAGAMQDTGRGVIMGPKGSTTYGKGSVQTLSTLGHSLDYDDNEDMQSSGLRLTTAYYYTPSGRSIPKEGIEPDVGVELPKGNEIEVLKHGLLGDPDRIEPKQKNGNGDEATTSTQEEINEPEEEPGDDQPLDDEGSLEEQLNKRNQEDEAESFHDVLLDEAVNYLKAFIIFESRKAA